MDENSKNTRYWRFNKKSPHVVDFFLSGKIGDPLINAPSLDEVKERISVIREELFGFGPEISLIRIFINSPGGFLPEASGVIEVLKSHTARKIVFIEYFAGSAGSLVAMCGNRIFMRENGKFFIHQAQMLAIGGSENLMTCAKELEKIERRLRQFYTGRTSFSDKKIRMMMVKESMFDAREACDLGFVDKIIPASESAEKEYSLFLSPGTGELLEHKCLRCVYGFTKKLREE